MTPLEKAAYDIGAKGSEPTENERLAFEAWMRGHCWKVIGDWDGKQYVHAHESTGFAHGGAMETRRLWAAWRDRGALAMVLAEQAQAVEPVPPCWYIEYESHGQVTLRKDEADSAIENGAIRVTAYACDTAQQVAVPQAMEDLTGVTVCCGDFAKCHRPCTPRGQWMATKAYQVTVPAGMAIVPTEALLDIKNRVNTLATLSLKAERYSVGRAIKQDIADMIAAAQGAKP